MKTREKVITTIFCLIVICLYLVISSYSHLNDQADKVYNVYLDGQKLGAIDSKDALYNLIDERQQNIKDKYNVKNVYPPNSLKVVENYSYNTKTTDLNEIYSKIEEMQDFTIAGYEVEVSKNEKHDGFKVYILDKQVLVDALENFILAFIDEEGYNSYINGTQKELDDIGVYYDDMKILENISIREKYISINDKIYETKEELAQALLFGFNYQEKTYTIKEGDTIESISDDNKLNVQEFLIANPKYSSKDSLLTIGETVNVTLIDPQVTFSYNVNEMKEVEINFEKEEVRDTTKEPGYSEITQPGVKGLEIQTSHYTLVNGETIGGVKIDDDPIVIRTKVNQITTKGRIENAWGWESAPINDNWAWPTENRFAIVSEFKWRWGRQHNGMDISGPGMGSRIYASNDGTVVKVVTGCPNNGTYGSTCGGGFGNHVIISHGNNIYTLYGHMLTNIPVKEGQKVTKKQVVGYMGNSGSSQGTHLHFGYSIGNPNSGGTWHNPREILYQ